MSLFPSKSGIRTRLTRLYNGGIDPGSVDAVNLRRRRTVASVAGLMIPVTVLLIISNLLMGLYYDASVVAVATVIASTLVWLLFKQISTDLAAILGVSMFYSIVTAIVLSSGLTGIGWIWYTPIPLTASLCASRKAGIVWSGICIFTVWLLALGHHMGAPWDGNLAQPAVQIAMELSLMVVTVLVVSQGFLASQEAAESALQGSLNLLKDEVEHRRLAESEAREAEMAKSRFLTTMSHEIRTPMNGVLGAAQLLGDTKLQPDQRDLLNTIQNSGEILLDLINDVLDLSRIEAGQMKLEQVPVKLATLMERVITPMRMLTRNSEVDLNLIVDPNLPEWISSDPTRLRQILLNLVGNAIKFTSSGSIAVRASRDQGLLVIEVQDSGVGISLDAQERLFEPFVQADTSTSREYGGSGLGLSIVLRIIELFEGEISVDSAPGEGATFRVQLPLQAADPQVNAERTPLGPKRNLGSLKVLLADDNDVNRMVARRMLEKLGHEVIEAENGAEAVRCTESMTIDLVLMDVQMPVMDGLDAAKAIRQTDERNSQIPILGLTANVGIEDRNAVLEAGMNAHLAKPIRVEILEEAIALHVQPNALTSLQNVPKH